MSRASALALCVALIATTGCGLRLIGKLPVDTPDASADTVRPNADAPLDADVNVDVNVDVDVDAIADADADAIVIADANADAPPDAPPWLGGLIAGLVTTKSDPTQRFASGVPGIQVMLDGPVTRSAVSDANGAFRFASLPAGPYTLSGVTTYATFSTALAIDEVNPSAVRVFPCQAPCGSGPTIDPDRELFIQDPSVTADARASNLTDGVWSFRFLMEQIASGMSPNAFANTWIQNLASSGRDVTRLRLEWPTVVENSQPVPDLSHAPFELLAIVNRIDLHAAGNGEVEFIYGIYDPPTAPQFNPQGRTFTVMFGFDLPSTPALPNRQAWAARFHELAQHALGAATDYDAQLQALTDLFARAGVVTSLPSNPRGSAFSVLRINEQFQSTGGPLQLREFRPLPDPTNGVVDLVVTTVQQTPDSSLNGQDGALPDFLNANAALEQVGLAVLPADLLAMQSTMAAPLVRWSFPSVTDEALRHAFGGQTCVGCHNTEASTTVYSPFHVSPFDGPIGRTYSGFVSGVELPRRIAFMQNQLTCSGASCAVGGEPFMGPE